MFRIEKSIQLSIDHRLSKIDKLPLHESWESLCHYIEVKAAGTKGRGIDKACSMPFVNDSPLRKAVIGGGRKQRGKVRGIKLYVF